jgi:hypothetical protein
MRGATKSQSVWNSLRDTIKQLTFAKIKDVAGAGGIPLETLSHLQQRSLPERGASKGELLDAIGVLLREFDEQNRLYCISKFVSASVRRSSSARDDILMRIERLGFVLTDDNQVVPCIAGEADRPVHIEKKPSIATPISSPKSTFLPAEVFISYSHADKEFLMDFLDHLKPLVRNEQLSVWSDETIVPGSHWFTDVQEAIRRARVAVFLVTKNFLASDFIHEHEFSPCVELERRGKLRIIWVPVRACAYQETPLANLQAAVDPKKPLAMMKAERDEAWVTICQVIKRALSS